ncbi:MAG: AzlD domain-containing protein [Chloroflexi bacterium]|jgi:branched-subunit amino acid transport protein|nr:AzlD domain-containing protein [Chloroflexota bacterium]
MGTTTSEVDLVYAWVLMIGMGLITFALRFGPLTLFSKIDLPRLAHQSFRLVIPAVFAALVMPVLVLINGTPILNPLTNPKLIAAVVAVIVAWRTNHMLLTLGAGMLVIWGLRWVGIG